MFSWFATPARRKRDEARAAAADAAARAELDQRFGTFQVACEGGDFKACNALGEWWSVVRGEYEKAAAIWRVSCEDGKVGDSCYNAALFALKGRGCERSPPTALRYLVMGCEYGNGDACHQAGMAFVKGRGVPADVERGGAYLGRACSKHSRWLSCAALGELHASGRHGVPRDTDKAVEYLEAGCSGLEPSACRNLSLMYKKGDGVPQDEAKADLYMDRLYTILESQLGRKIPR